MDGAVVDQLRLVEFSHDTNLSAAGNSLYSAPPNSALPAATSSVRQGLLENSNVSPVAAVVDLITIQRNADLLAHAMNVFDTQFNQTAVQDLPRV